MPCRRTAIAVLPALVGVLCVAGSAVAAPSATTYRISVPDPAHDVETTPTEPASPTDDLRKVTVTHTAKHVTISFRTTKYSGYVGASTEFHYVVNLQYQTGELTRSYRLAVDLAGSQALLPNSTPVAHHKHLFEQVGVVVFTNSQPAQRGCGGMHLVPTRQHAWTETVPDSCLPHFRTPLTVSGSREREVDEGPGLPAHDYEDDFQS